MNIAVIGGTGNLGAGLALRWAQAGHDVVIGSRSAARAEQAASAMNQRMATTRFSGAVNGTAAAAAEVVVLAVPWAGRSEILTAIRSGCAGKVVVDTTVPLGAHPTIPGLDDDSAAEQAQRELGPACRVVAGFHHVSARLLSDLANPVEADVLICGDDESARQTALDLAAALPARAFDCGRLVTARTLERLTPLIIGLNMRYKRRHIGLRLTGI